MKKIALVFSGQGSQYVKMGQALYEEHAAAKETFDEANDVLGFDLKKLCFEGDMKELTLTENAQPAILTASTAAFRVFKQQIGIEPVCAAGHSLGEYSALVASGVLSFKDALKLVRKRGELMQEAVSADDGAMAAIKDMPKEVVEIECQRISEPDHVVVVSNYNAPQQTVISGHKAAVNKAVVKLQQMGGTVIPLNVSAPFHSPLMQSVSEHMNSQLMKYEYHPFEFPVIANVTAQAYTAPLEVIDSLTEQIVKPVLWTSTMSYMSGLGLDAIVEIGPQAVLRNLVEKNGLNIKAYAYDKPQDVSDLQQNLKEQRVNTPEVAGSSRPTLVTRCMAIAVCTRNQNWDNDEYNEGVSKPYKKIQQMQNEIEQSGAEPTLEQMEAALYMLQSVFTTKKTSDEIQVERFNQVFDETGTRHLFPDFLEKRLQLSASK
ncbi:ACP S-malonyltransferase [Paenibacillus sp.]|jgi:[acyl-carrier-protein] S-malonyltransferase|uniref:ACP S-malonyltransferase n=1 Tax=Paenibacillus sp. TaxID=58172 RepID=UPI00281F51F1|nr:ACP S-malonyltransferase [Paenibacillus sp.]MDR0270276.1 ACP S-malonyltransferase [Paenibacillus sp.]